MKAVERAILIHKDGSQTEVLVTDYKITIPYGRPWTYELKGFLAKPHAAPQAPSTPEQPKVPVCECFKDKHGFAGHAPWCPIKD